MKKNLHFLFSLVAMVLFSVTAKAQVTIDTDLTSSFGALTQASNWKNIDGGNGAYTSTNFCPAVTTNAGQTVQVVEYYRPSCDYTGTVLSQTVTGLSAGTYRIELYGAAAFTCTRGFGSTAFTGDLTVDRNADLTEGYKIDPSEDVSTGVVLYAETSEGTYGGEIPIYYAQSFPDGAATVVLDGVVIGNDGKITIGMSKTSTSTNWHVIQLKGVTATLNADAYLAATVAKAEAVETDVPAAVYANLKAVVDANNTTYGTGDEYLAAVAAIEEAITAANATAWAPLTATLAQADAIKANVTDEASLAAYDEAVAEVLAAYEAGTTTDFAAAIATIKAALPALVKAQTAPGSDYTLAIVNPTIDGADGWTIDRPLGGNGPLLGGTSFEYWAGNASNRAEASFDYNQVIEGLPNGIYTVSAEMYNSLNGEGGNYTVFSATSGVYAASGEDNEVSALVDVDGTDLNRYTTEGILVTNGTLRIGVKNVTTPMAARWFVADNFQLTLVRTVSVPTNLDFAAGEPLTVGVHTYAKDIVGENVAQAQPVEGWTIVNNGDARAAGVFTYSSTNFLGGDGYVAPPVNPAGTYEGQALGVVGVWSADVQYTQPATFTAGKYVITVPVFNSVGGTTDIVKNLIGFVEDGGTEHLAENKTYAVNKWTFETITFDADDLVDGKLSVGYQAANSGSGAMPHLFLANVDIQKFDTDEERDAYLATVPALQEQANAALAVALAKDKLEQAIATASEVVEAAEGVGEGLFEIKPEAGDTYTEAIEAAMTVLEQGWDEEGDEQPATLDELNAAIEALAAATATYYASVNTPDEEQAYTLQLKDGGNYLTLDNGTKLSDQPAQLWFKAVEGGYAITNGEEYAACTGTDKNNWSMGASQTAYAWTITAIGDGFYRITKPGKSGEGIGVDKTEAGSSCYANKAESDKAVWTIAEYVAPAPTEVEIVVTDALENDGRFFRTFSSQYALDFTEAEGITAYVAKKDVNDTKPQAVLTQVDKVPANTGIVVIAEAAGTYTVAITDEEIEAIEGNDLVAALERTDISTLQETGTYGELTATAATLQKTTVPSFDWTTWEEVDKDVFGFVRVDAVEEGESFIEAGEAYFALDADEITDLNYAEAPVLNIKVAGEETVVELANIAELKALEADAVVNLTLTNAQVTYAGSVTDEYYGDTTEYLVLEDATGAVRLQNTGLAAYLATGNVLTGVLPLNVTITWGMAEYTLAQDPLTLSLDVAEGTAEPLAITDENLADYLESYEWRYVKFDEVPVTIQNGEVVAEILDNEVKILDSFGTGVELPTEDANVNLEGFLYEYSIIDALVFQPTKLTVNIPKVTLTAELSIESGVQTTPGTAEGFTQVEAGTPVILKLHAENLEENGLNPDELTVKFGMVMAGLYPTPSWTMGTGKTLRQQNVEVPFAEEINLDEVLGEPILTTEYAFLQSLNVVAINLQDAEGTGLAGISTPLVLRFVEVTLNGESVPTGIDRIAIDTENSAVYDLAGRRVKNIVKGGMYIINGKKTLVK